MNSKIEHVVDSNAIANDIMHSIMNVDRMEEMLKSDLSSADLFRIDSAILSSLRNTQDFSRDLLHQLEAGRFEAIVQPPKSFETDLQIIQQEAIMDITLPLQNMFDDMAEIVVEALEGV